MKPSPLYYNIITSCYKFKKIYVRNPEFVFMTDFFYFFKQQNIQIICKMHLNYSLVFLLVLTTSLDKILKLIHGLKTSLQRYTNGYIRILENLHSLQISLFRSILWIFQQSFNFFLLFSFFQVFIYLTDIYIKYFFLDHYF